MKRIHLLGIGLLTLVCLGATPEATKDGFTDKFDISADHFSSTGKNDFFILEPGYQTTYEGVEDGEKGKLIITVLDETKKLGDIETRVVEEREWSGDDLVEISRNYFAVDKTTNDVYYFGEDVDTFKNGKSTGHAGSWHHGENGAHFGLAMPADPKVGQKYYQELAPKEAMDRAEVVSISEEITVPAGKYSNCLKTLETSPLEPDSKEHKFYAPKVGLIIDGGLKLVKFGQKDQKAN
jgi:hypothetical protein